MKRKIYSELLNWKQKYNGEVAILVDGARRIGKSFIVEEFAQKEYKSYVLFDFGKVGEGIKNLFENYLDKLDVFFQYVSLETGVKLYERNTVFIFDEVQNYPKARAAIKYLVADGRYDYIETGSLVSINKNVKDIIIPSEERRIDMYPMDFEEFLWAMGNDNLMDFIRDCFANKRPLGNSLHRKAMEYFRQYMIVGGMPQAVEKYIKTRDFVEVDKIKRDILKLYRNDISKYATGVEAKVTGIYDKLASQLQRHEKRFKLSDVRTGGKMRDFQTSFFWLSESRVVNICYKSTEPSIGLELKLDDSTIKLYMADTGLLISHAFSEAQITNNQLYKKLMLDKLEINKGMLVENVVAQMLVAGGHKLFFYSNATRESVDDRMEIDFLIAKPVITNRHNISPIEVKSSSNYTLTSLEKCIKKYNAYLATPYVIHSADLEEKNGILYLPLYMTPLL